MTTCPICDEQSPVLEGARPVIAIVGGLVAATMWAASTLCISRSTRMIPPVAVLEWVLLIGSVISTLFALAQACPTASDGSRLRCSP